jgi:hypothetical protein
MSWFPSTARGGFCGTKPGAGSPQISTPPTAPRLSISCWIHCAMRRALSLMSGSDLNAKIVSFGTPSRAILQMAEEFS